MTFQLCIHVMHFVQNTLKDNQPDHTFRMIAGHKMSNWNHLPAQEMFT